MKWLLALMLVGAAALALSFVPPKKAALATAHGLRAGWTWLLSLGPRKPAQATAPPAKRKVQASVGKRTSREGIVAQRPKENLKADDRAALDALVHRSTPAGK
ncbi:MAG TPA: hypothetical protein VLW85_12850 [Myxococcales bacterium]|nr:hypothetical protein [Myxococcales bacterium]